VNSLLFDQLKPNEQGAIKTFLDRLWLEHPGRIVQAILFGSKSRGDSQPESDIDILLVVDEEDWRFSHAISDIAADVSLEYNLLIEPRVVGQERWQRLAGEHFNLYENVTREGMLITPEPMSLDEINEIVHQVRRQRRKE
jgi:predicted nucleotidyltransferase